MKRCYKCDCESGKGPNELRPYGPRGEWICFRCAFATPEATEQTKGAFRAQVEAAGPIVLIGEETGPRPGPALNEGPDSDDPDDDGPCPDRRCTGF